MAQRSTNDVVGIEPDLTPETLPLLDGYLRAIPHDTTQPVLELVLAAVGCYFGEVVRRKLDGRWGLVSEDPARWRIEMVNCYLHFRPVGMAAEVFRRGACEGFDGSLGTLDDDALGQMLARAAPMSEDDYHSFGGRFDVLALVVDWLVGQSMAQRNPPRVFGAEEYRVRLDDPQGS